MRNTIKRGIIMLTGCTFFLGACSHRLEIKNLSDYRSTDITPLKKRPSIGIITAEQDVHLKQMVKQVGNELQKYSDEVVLPFQPTGTKRVDVTADIRILPEYKGSGANFFINWPGFLIWAPAWHGYNYSVNYNVNVILMDPLKNEKIDEFSVPIKLDVRHAAGNRTWTEVSWFEVSAIAFIGGLCFMNYDASVTPLVLEAAGQTLGEYIGDEIVSHLNSSGRFSFFLDEKGSYSRLG